MSLSGVIVVFLLIAPTVFAFALWRRIKDLQDRVEAYQEQAPNLHDQWMMYHEAKLWQKQRYEQEADRYVKSIEPSPERPEHLQAATIGLNHLVAKISHQLLADSGVEDADLIKVQRLALHVANGLRYHDERVAQIAVKRHQKEQHERAQSEEAESKRVEAERVAAAERGGSGGDQGSLPNHGRLPDPEGSDQS